MPKYRGGVGWGGGAGVAEIFLFLKHVRRYTITLKQKSLFTIFKGLLQYNFHIVLDLYQDFWGSGLRDSFSLSIKITTKTSFVAHHIIFKI